MVLKNGRSHGITKKRFGVCKYRRLNMICTHRYYWFIKVIGEVNDVIQVTDNLFYTRAFSTLGDYQVVTLQRKCTEIGANPKDAIRIKILFHPQ
jgi:hypothetical protein